VPKRRLPVAGLFALIDHGPIGIRRELIMSPYASTGFLVASLCARWSSQAMYG
jgi:hypothetical protein